MRGQWQLGSFFGIPFYLDYSWFVIVGLVTLANAGEINSQFLGGNQSLYGVGLGFLMALLLFASVLLHELGHSLVAQAQGIRVNSITLFLFGGVASIERESKTPLGAFFVAIAGPLVSFGLFGSFEILGFFLRDFPIFRYGANSLSDINLFLGLFNLIPGLPLDGGQVLKALVWKISGDRLVGIEWAARSGQVLGVIGISLGLTLWLVVGDIGGAWLALIGWFVWRNAYSYRKVSQLQKDLKKLQAKEVMTRDFKVVKASLTLREFTETYLLDSSPLVIPYYAASEGRYRGLIRVNLLQEIERSEWDWLTLQDIALPLTESPSCLENTNLAQVIVQLEMSGDRFITVLSPAQAVAGVIDRGDVVKAISEQQGLNLNEEEIKRIKTEGLYPNYLPLANLAKSLD
ncbi:MAG: site-2 protease family protein [Microcystaceae cyanobacterium]